jgi:hypothetical protein
LCRTASSARQSVSPMRQDEGKPGQASCLANGASRASHGGRLSVFAIDMSNRRLRILTAILDQHLICYEPGDLNGPHADHHPKIPTTATVHRRAHHADHLPPLPLSCSSTKGLTHGPTSQCGPAHSRTARRDRQPAAELGRTPPRLLRVRKNSVFEGFGSTRTVPRSISAVHWACRATPRTRDRGACCAKKRNGWRGS